MLFKMPRIAFGAFVVVLAMVAALHFSERPAATPSDAMSDVSSGTRSNEQLPMSFSTRGEPHSGLDITFEPVWRVGKPGAGSASLTVEVDEALDASSLSIQLSASGKALLKSEPLLSVPADGAAPLSVQVDYIVAGGAGAVTAAVSAIDEDNAALVTEVATVSLLDAHDEVLAGTAGIPALRVASFDRHEAAEAPQEQRAELRAALLDGVATTNRVAPADALEAERALALAPGPDEVGVEGTVSWTDENGVEHPYRFAELQVWEDDTLSGDDLITTTTTDANGAFAVVVDNNDGVGQGGRDIYVRPRTVGTSFRVVTTGDDVYSLRSPNVNDADGGATYVFTMVGANDDTPGRAMSVHQSMALAVPYVQRVEGTLRDLDVVYPNGGTGSFYNGDLEIEEADSWDWDTIHHEYGHFVAEQINIEDNPGGAHNLGDNLSETRGNKSEGTRLAWGEGWPTYFAISLQQEENAASLNVPRVGDTRYQAFETAASGIDYSMETTDGGGSPGEDNEVAVQRALWDLYDNANDDGDTDVSLGDQVIWDRLDAADPVNFSEGWQALLAPMTAQERAAASCIAGEWGMSPNLASPVDGQSFSAAAAPPTFRWAARGGGPTYLNDEFTIRFTTPDHSRVVFEQDAITATDFTPTQAQWDQIRRFRSITWTVIGTQSDDPATGPYQSCGRTLRLEVGPGAFYSNAGCTTNTLVRNDDGSTSLTPLGFDVDFFGGTYSSLYVNNNGNITFDSPLSTYTPFPLLSTSRVIVAPFFGDVDTRSLGSDAVTYGQATFGSRPAFCVNWDNVGYYSNGADKTNSFQLMLVDRSNISPGDFDIIFNFDRVEWEAGSASGGSGGLGGSAARSGYASAGFDALELQGSGINGAFLDSNNATGLIHGSLNSTQDGRYIFRVRNGAVDGVALSGLITAQDGTPLAGSPIDVCANSGGCVSTSSNSLGEYRVEPVPSGQYTIRAGAPAGTDYNTTTVGPITVGDSDLVVDVVLQGPVPPPAGTTIEPSRSGGSVPVVYYNDELTLTSNGCVGGVASYSIAIGGTEIASGGMVEGPPGTYTSVVPPLSPSVGYADVSISITCPDPADSTTIQFTIYIDPSGTVLTTGGDPVEGAIVTLFRSDFAEGPFEQVPDGSAIMSPANRQNPMSTGSDGHYGWDTIAGYYVVRAEAPGCVNPIDETISYVESAVLPVPPPQLGIDLVLDCGEPATPEALLLAMKETVESLSGDAPPGIVQSLTVKLERTLSALAEGKTNLACNTLTAFDGEANALAGKHVYDITADELLSTSNQVRELMGCRR